MALEQRGDDALHRAHGAAMDHHRSFPGVAGADVAEVEPLRMQACTGVRQSRHA